MVVKRISHVAVSFSSSWFDGRHVIKICNSTPCTLLVHRRLSAWLMETMTSG